MLWYSKHNKIGIFCAQMVDFCRPGHIYRIAEKFRGQKFSRLTSLKTVCELNFKDRLDCHCICMLQKFLRINFRGSSENHEISEIYRTVEPFDPPTQNTINIYSIASNYGPGVYFFPTIFNQTTKQDRRLLSEETRAVYNLRC